MSLSPFTWVFFCLFTFALAGLFFTTRKEKAAANKLRESRRNKAIETPEEYEVLLEKLDYLSDQPDLKAKAVALIKDYEKKLELIQFIKLNQSQSEKNVNN
ncbi:hypothetical protein CYQ88_09895 [Hydrogenovibrio sp. SC-1]|uniref:hypothetical protein n=1 Tax=Hydrogenovibrio sp. SC-1 TaxID=2065820 RepID=UPI000C7A26A6|nr:hypothetical protein [Hydrogenovibrio sp. SC-1]PLA73678.1 hypothetical protein CYQ88_09820 [Hydrogenovibrio sp. SC-1]PLA73693.1 hypothetical protein CYQ88_09895 [Hydrogenovibrio sp. SC-1]